MVYIMRCTCCFACTYMAWAGHFTTQASSGTAATTGQSAQPMAEYCMTSKVDVDNDHQQLQQMEELSIETLVAMGVEDSEAVKN